MRRLIVNADDFGLTRGINRAVVDLHQSGALGSATLMVASPRFDEAVDLANQHPTLGVGCHVVLVDGSPVADPASIPTLIEAATSDRPARFRPALATFVRDLSLGRIQREHIEREAAAQILRLQQAGIHVTHVDTHKHTHMFPAVLDALLRAAETCGVRAVRNPFEPAWSLTATPKSGFVRKLQVRCLNSFRRNFRRQVRERGFSTTDGCVGVLATGTLNEEALGSILRAMPEGTWELVCHPGYMDDELRSVGTRLKDSRLVELTALQSLPEFLAGRIQQIHFGQL